MFTMLVLPIDDYRKEMIKCLNGMNILHLHASGPAIGKHMKDRESSI